MKHEMIQHTPWQSSTTLLGAVTIIEDLWERYFPEICRDNRKAHDYQRILMLVHGRFCADHDLTVLELKRCIEDELMLSPNSVEQRLEALFDLGLVEKIKNPNNQRQKLPRPTADALKRLMKMGDELAHYVRHLNGLLPSRGGMPPSTIPEMGHFDPLPQFNGAAL